MQLDAVAIEFDFMKPTVAAGHLLDRSRLRGLDEPRIGRLGADRRRLFALERHGLHEAHRKRQLIIVISAFVSVDEILKEKRDIPQLQITAPP